MIEREIKRDSKMSCRKRRIEIKKTSIFAHLERRNTDNIVNEEGKNEKEKRVNVGGGDK